MSNTVTCLLLISATVLLSCKSWHTSAKLNPANILHTIASKFGLGVDNLKDLFLLRPVSSPKKVDLMASENIIKTVEHTLENRTNTTSKQHLVKDVLWKLAMDFMTPLGNVFATHVIWYLSKILEYVGPLAITTVLDVAVQVINFVTSCAEFLVAVYKTLP